MFRLTIFLTVLLTAQYANADELPTGVTDTQNPDDRSLSPEESLARITVPEGFHVTLFAGEPDIRRPIAFDFDDRGRLWVVENYSHPHWKEDNATDRIIILEDTDNDGRFDKRKVFWDKGRYVTGIAIGHGGVWIADTPYVSLIRDENHDDIPDAEPQPVLEGFNVSSNNVVNNLHWGPDGYLYGAIGLSSKSLVNHRGGQRDDPKTTITRGIWRFKPHGWKFEKVAEGMVNPWGADFNEYGDLFTSNTVLAHLWHIVPGMYCERRASERDNPYAYGRIQTIANHLHWGGGVWNDSRNPSSRKPKDDHAASSDHDDEEYHRHSVAGGGHAHCGAMVYLGDNWPNKYRGTFFTNNLHGNRVNNDRLEPKRSTYVATHSPDFLFGNDPWFRGMSIKYGPDGGVYVSDWHDYGECHDSDGSHRSSGRIYKVTYGKPSSKPFDLQKMTNMELVKLQTHTNEWFVRHARRILSERDARGVDVTDTAESLLELFRTSDNVVHQLRAIWALWGSQQLNLSHLHELLNHSNPYLRGWGVRLLVDGRRCDNSESTHTSTWLPESFAKQLANMAASEQSPRVRLELACALQRMEHRHRIAVAEGLSQNPEDAVDPYLPLMIWYGLEPAVPNSVTESLRLAVNSKIPLIREYIARRISDMPEPPLNEVLAVANEAPDQVALDLLRGMNAALGDKGSFDPPDSWGPLYGRISESSVAELRAIGFRLATVFGDSNVIESLRKSVMDTASNVTTRREALNSLLNLDNGVSVDMLHQIAIDDTSLRDEALRALVVRNAPDTPTILLRSFETFSPEQKQAAVAVLATRRPFAVALLDAIQTEQVPRNAVSTFALQQLRSFKDTDLQKQIAAVWADDDISLRKSDELKRLTQKMTPEHLAAGDASAGRLVFSRTCAKCHTLFGDGGTIAPDLTGSGRRKADYVISNLVDPNAQIDEAYRLTSVITEDGRLFSGFIAKQDDTWLHLRTQDAKVRLKMKDVEKLSTSKVSMMPEGMLRTFTDQEIRDLLVYLASEEQVALPAVPE